MLLSDYLKDGNCNSSRDTLESCFPEYFTEVANEMLWYKYIYVCVCMNIYIYIYQLDGIIDSMDMSMSKFREIVKDREAWSAAGHGIAKSPTQLSDWTTTTKFMVEDSLLKIIKVQWLHNILGVLTQNLTQ